MKATSLQLDPSLHRQAKTIASNRGVTMKSFFAAAIAAAVEKDLKAQKKGKV